jgi:hypothetical protein
LELDGEPTKRRNFDPDEDVALAVLAASSLEESLEALRVARICEFLESLFDFGVGVQGASVTESLSLRERVAAGRVREDLERQPMLKSESLIRPFGPPSPGGRRLESSGTREGSVLSSHDVCRQQIVRRKIFELRRELRQIDFR